MLSLLRRLIFWLVLTSGGLLAKEPRAFFKTYCLRCHDADKQKGDFRLDILKREFGAEATAQTWAEVLFRINSGEMPPKKEKQPSAAELGEVAEWISQAIEAGRAERMGIGADDVFVFYDTYHQSKASLGGGNRLRGLPA